MRKAFSIVELSLVIIVIGLIAVTISIGSSMFQEVKIKSMIFDLQDIDMAYTNFKGMYNKVPGDMEYADAYWDNCAETSAYCNGNGNGIVEIGNSAANDEIIKAWKHLSLSGFFSFTSDPIPDTHDGTIVPGVNSPESSIENVGFFIGGGQLISNSSGAFSPFIQEVNSIFMGCIAPSGSHDPLVGGGLTPEIAFLIDKKVDNGMVDSSGNWIGAATGTIRVIDGTMFSSGDCYTGDVYNRSTLQPACVAGRAINYITGSPDIIVAQAPSEPESEPEPEAGGAEEPIFPEWVPQWMRDAYTSNGNSWPFWLGWMNAYM